MGGTPLTPAARISALSIVGDLLRKVGVRPAPPGWRGASPTFRVFARHSLASSFPSNAGLAF